MDSTLRSGMAYLIHHLRLMIGEAGNEVLTDLDIQHYLDNYRTDVDFDSLTHINTYGQDARIQFRKYSHPGTYWEDSVQLTDVSFKNLTPDDYELIRGIWYFNTDHYPPVRISGHYYDVDSAAWDCFEPIISYWKFQYDTADPAQRLSLSQIVKNLEERQVKLASRRNPVYTELY